MVQRTSFQVVSAVVVVGFDAGGDARAQLGAMYQARAVHTLDGNLKCH